MIRPATALRRVGVTGAAGFLGRYVVRELGAAGYDVVGVDRRAPERPARGARAFRAGDLLDPGALPALLGDCDAVVHLAARPSPSCGTPEDVFAENVRTAANVLDLAEARGMARVVLASSECVVGYAYGPTPFPLDYLPVDEAHPLRAVDPYGRSKRVCEELAAAAAARSGLVTVALRPSWVHALERTTRREWARAHHRPPGPHPHNFWGYVDARDAARAFRLALEAPLAGFEAFFVTARETRHALPTLELLRPYWPDGLPPGAATLPSHHPVVSTSKAERVLGWTPEHSWRDLGVGWPDAARWAREAVAERPRLASAARLVRRLVRQPRHPAHTA